MSKQQQIDWNESNIIDDVAFQEEDAKQFKNLLNRKEETAVALGVALGASRVEFYKDVDGVYSADPKKDLGAKQFAELSFDEALDIVEKGAKVLHARSIRLAKKNHLPLRVLSFYDPELRSSMGTLIGPGEKREDECIYES